MTRIRATVEIDGALLEGHALLVQIFPQRAVGQPEAAELPVELVGLRSRQPRLAAGRQMIQVCFGGLLPEPGRRALPA